MNPPQSTVMTTTVLSLFILCMLSGTLVFSDEVSSEPVSLGKGNHRLVYDSTNGFKLIKEGDNRIPVSNRPIEQTSSMHIVSASDRVLDIALSRLGSASFIGTVHSRNRECDVFTFLTIANPESSSPTVKATAAEAIKCETGHRILALSGNRRGDVVTLVVGRISTTEVGGVVSSGRIVFHGCPYPSPANGRVGKFTPEYAPLLPLKVESVEEMPLDRLEGER